MWIKRDGPESKVCQKTLDLLDSRNALLISQKCGEWPKIFDTIVANTQLLLDPIKK